MDRHVTHEFAFRHGVARFAEDFDVDALRGLLFDLGFGEVKAIETQQTFGTHPFTL